MKRQWCLDHTAPIGDKRLWKGDPEKLSAPWIHCCTETYPNKLMSNKRCLGGTITQDSGSSWTSVHIIKKLDNLEYILYLKERT